MLIEKTHLPGVLVLQPDAYPDRRGLFKEAYRAVRYREMGIDLPFVQDNHSRSVKGVLRGMHYQLNHPQGKLLHVVRGSCYDVVIDVRQGSPTFGQWFGVELSEDNHRQIYVPPGYAHGFYTTSDIIDVIYKCTDYYHPEDDYGVNWNDPDIGIAWPITVPPLLSPKDAALPRLGEIPARRLPVWPG